MYEVFFQTLKTKVPFSEDELEVIKTYLTPKKLRKKQYLLQEYIKKRLFKTGLMTFEVVLISIIFVYYRRNAYTKPG